ncbi:hypothetical protein C8Q74DRAFT_1315843 [Fomes fomentarius]|nr:hypothetical protein C8Q74DRAFT_1315843 [Fomes fomentarius]
MARRKSQHSFNHPMQSICTHSQNSALTFSTLGSYLEPYTTLKNSTPTSAHNPPADERVVILGASRGIGRVLALRYALVGARVCIVARREEKLANVAEECRVAAKTRSTTDYEPILSMKGDFTVIEDMISVRNRVRSEWNGFDTLVVCAGVPTFLPFFELAGVESCGHSLAPPQTDKLAIGRIGDMVTAVTRTNYMGPVMAAATFIPALASSKAPAVVLMSSLAAVLPAPTISLYNASKSASFMFYQSLAIENPSIAFTCVLPSTVLGEAHFQSAADGGKPRGVDPQSYGISQELVVDRCIEAVDKGEKTVYIPRLGWNAHILSLLFPSFISYIARSRYGYPVD